MRSAFQRTRTRTVRPTLVEDEEDDPDARVVVSSALVNALVGGDHRVETLAIAPLHLATGQPDFPLVVSIDGIRIPRALHLAHPAHFALPRSISNTTREDTHAISAVRVATLSSVFVAAVTPDAHSMDACERLRVVLCEDNRIVRQGETIAISYSDSLSIPRSPMSPRSPGIVNGNGAPRPALFKILACEPVLQGFASRERTRVHVTQADDSLNSLADDALISPAESSSGDELEIDEFFLAASFAVPLVRRPPFQYAQSESSQSTSDLSVFTTDEDGAPEARSNRASRLADSRAETLVALQAPIIGQGGSDERVLNVSSHVLGRTGLFAGDWAVVCQRRRSTSLASASMAEHRLVQLLPADSSTGSIPCASSPTLLANIAGDTLFQDISKTAPTAQLETSISLFPTPFGASVPPIPTARALTVARVTSAASTDRRLQPICVNSLKAYFAQTKRLVKKGDLLAVSIDRTQAQAIGEDEGANEDMDLAVMSATMPSDIVFFKITNLEYSTVDLSASTLPDTPDDIYTAATMGELGVWVDSDVTKMMQAGIERSRVPDCSTYLGLEPIPVVQDHSAVLQPWSQNQKKVRDVVGACLRANAWEYSLHLSALVRGPRGSGKTSLIRRVARQIGLSIYEINCYDMVGESESATEGVLRARFQRATECAPCILLLRQVHALARTSQTMETGRDPLVVAALRNCLEDLQISWRATEHPVFVVATTSEHDRMPPALLACFKHDIVLDTPAEQERLEILQSIVQQSGKVLGPDVSLESLATQTAALVAADLVDLVYRAGLAAIRRGLNATAGSGVSEQDLALAGLAMTASDFDNGLTHARAAYSTSIGAPRIPSVSWDDVGGLASVKSEILDTIQLPLEHPELFAGGLKKRSGILLCALNFFSVKGPELLNMYIGESEANVRRVFARARAARPCVIFFDELDSVAPRRGIQGDSGGVMDRIVSQLLAELDGVSEGDSVGDVFVIGATNRPDLLDPALLRPGRFDRMLYLGISDTHEAQLRILQALTRKFKLHPDLDLAAISEQCPFNYTGADFYALCSDAMLKAMSRKAQEIDRRIEEINGAPSSHSTGHPHPMTSQYYLAELATPAEISVLVSQEDFELALFELVPSVSQSELDHYATVQARFANETIGSTQSKGKGKARAD
ncbi:AAA-domain-containing protein [Auriculariales sp. MPI-PUGE-AT-0066]|nr:AAA-domain-containing protein [Auriculariales sp. MPI-PUGE-AT-0066]